jgi:tetratricopeptide (TPR) repeat protein
VAAKDLNELADAMLSAAQRVDEANALLAYDLVLAIRAEEARKTGTQSSAAKLQVVISLFSKGVLFHTTHRHQEAIAVYDELLHRYKDDKDPGLQPYVATALLNKGIALGSSGQAPAAIAVYDELLGRYREAEETALREQVAKTLINKGVLFGTMDRTDDEIALYEEVLQRYGEATEPALHEQVAKALRNKGVALGTRNHGEEEIAMYDELLRRYGEATEPILREQVAMALVSKGITLGNLGRYDEAHAACLEVVRRFEQTDDPVLKEQVANALNTLGFNTLISAKALLLRGEKQKAEEELRSAENYITASLQRIPDPVTLGNNGYVAFLLGNKDSAREILTRAISLGGESIRAAELKDAEINRLPEDDEFCEMVRSIQIPPAG